jgi:hypothetical protein
VTGQLVQFFAAFSQPISDWVEERPDADLNWLIRQEIEPVYDQLIRRLRLYETNKAAEMVGQQMEADAFVRQDDFPGRTLPDIVAELAEGASYSWVHRGFTRITIDDDLYRSLAQFFREGPDKIKRTPIYQPALFVLRYWPQIGWRPHEAYNGSNERQAVLPQNGRTGHRSRNRRSTQRGDIADENG